MDGSRDLGSVGGNGGGGKHGGGGGGTMGIASPLAHWSWGVRHLDRDFALGLAISPFLTRAGLFYEVSTPPVVALTHVADTTKPGLVVRPLSV